MNRIGEPMLRRAIVRERAASSASSEVEPSGVLIARAPS